MLYTARMPKSKLLSGVSVQELREMYDGGMSLMELARKYCVHYTRMKSLLKETGDIRTSGESQKLSHDLSLAKRISAGFDPSAEKLYEIHCSATNKSYIGSTKRGRERWHEHSKLLRDGKHWRPEMQRDWDRHGRVTFSFSFIEGKSEADVIESYWAKGKKLYNAHDARGFLGANNPMFGVKHTDETRLKMSLNRVASRNLPRRRRPRR